MMVLNVLHQAVIRASSVITTTPINLPAAVPLSSGDVTSALTGFFSIGPVLGVIALVIALLLVPLVIRAFRSLGARR